MILSKQFKLMIFGFIILALLLSPGLYAKQTGTVYLDGFSTFVEKMRQEWNVPGCAVAIVKNGKIVFAKGFGFRDAEKKLPVTERTLFAIGSCTKAFTATLLGILVDEGKLDWNKPVREYLPDFQLLDETATRLMTPVDLVTHRSGLPRHDLLWYASAASREDIYQRLRYLESSASFRERFQYNNLMFMTAGYMAGKIAGTTWESLIKEKIIDPLGMKTTNFSVTDSQKAADFSVPFTARGEGKDKQIIAIPFRLIDNAGPAGSINSCVAEMSNWIILNLAKGKFAGKQIISEANLAMIHSPQIVSSSALSESEEFFYALYAMGWGVISYQGQPVLSHEGGIDGFISQVGFLPRQNAGFVILTNSDDGGNDLCTVLARNIYDRVLGKKLLPWDKRVREQQAKDRKAREEAEKKERLAGTSPSHPLSAYVGEYEHPAYGVMEITLNEAGDRLLSKLNDLSAKGEHFHYDIFEFVQADRNQSKILVTFLTDLKGNISSMSVPLQAGVKDIVFTRMPEKKMKERKFLEQFAGEYDLMGMKALITLLGGDTLILTVPGQPFYELEPYKDTTFNIKNLTGFAIAFVVDASGQVTGFDAHLPNGVVPAKKIK